MSTSMQRGCRILSNVQRRTQCMEESTRSCGAQLPKFRHGTPWKHRFSPILNQIRTCLTMRCGLERIAWILLSNHILHCMTDVLVLTLQNRHYGTLPGWTRKMIGLYTNLHRKREVGWFERKYTVKVFEAFLDDTYTMHAYLSKREVPREIPNSKSPETRQVQERFVSTLEPMQIPKWERTRWTQE